MALHDAAQDGNVPEVERLLSAGLVDLAGKPTRNSAGETPLFAACANGRAEMVQLLLEQRAASRAMFSKDISTSITYCDDCQSLSWIKHTGMSGLFVVPYEDLIYLIPNNLLTDELMEELQGMAEDWIESGCMKDGSKERLSSMHMPVVEDVRIAQQKAETKQRALLVIDEPTETPEKPRRRILCRSTHDKTRKEVHKEYEKPWLSKKPPQCSFSASLIRHQLQSDRDREENAATVLCVGWVDANLTKSTDGMSPACAATAGRHEEVLDLLLEGKADPNLASADGGTPLFMAIQAGHYSLVERLLYARADPNGAVQSMQTPVQFLTLALLHKGESAHDFEHAYEALEKVLRAGAEPDRVNDDSNCAALLAAAVNDSTDALELLLDARADPNQRDPEYQATVLSWSAQNANVDAVTALINHRADVNAVSGAEPPETPLDIAKGLLDATEDAKACFEVLKSSGAKEYKELS
eukprot:symbB.v1.2.019215.t2/scaffold1565.1/size111341/2